MTNFQTAAEHLHVNEPGSWGATAATCSACHPPQRSLAAVHAGRSAVGAAHLPPPAPHGQRATWRFRHQDDGNAISPARISGYQQKLSTDRGAAKPRVVPPRTAGATEATRPDLGVPAGPQARLRDATGAHRLQPPGYAAGAQNAKAPGSQDGYRAGGLRFRLWRRGLQRGGAGGTQGVGLHAGTWGRSP